jgi:hypothetical protein
MVEYKGGGCYLCGYDRCLRALDFHHLDPATKRFTIAGGHTRSWASLRTELDKCMLVCSNCHIELEQAATKGRRGPRQSATATTEPLQTCRVCGRRFVYDRRKGHSRTRCNSCGSNRGSPEQRYALKRDLIAIGGGSCRICGYCRTMHALTFHHVEPTKKRFHIRGSHGRSFKALAAEVAKCVLVCANCHDEIEAGETQVPKNLADAVRKATARVPELRRPRSGRPAGIPNSSTR